MFCMAAQSLGYKVVVLDPGARQPGRQRRRPPHRAPTTSIRAALARARALRRRGDHRVRERAGGGARVPGAHARASRRPPRASPSRRTASARRRSSPGTASPSRRSRCCAREADARAGGPRARCPASSRARASATTARARSACARATTSSPPGARWAASRACSSSFVALACEVSVDRRAQRARRSRRPGRSPRIGIATAFSTSRSCPRACSAAARRARRATSRRRSPTALDYRGVLCVEMFVARRRRAARQRDRAAPAQQRPLHDRRLRDVAVRAAGARARRPAARATRAARPAVMVNLLGDLWFADAAHGAARARLAARAPPPAGEAASLRQGASRGAGARWGTSPASARRSTTRSRPRARSSATSAFPAPTSSDARLAMSAALRPDHSPACACSTSRACCRARCARSTSPISAPTSSRSRTPVPATTRAISATAPGTVSAFFRAVNRNKRSVALDLKDPADARRSSRSRATPTRSSRASDPASWRRSGSTHARSPRINPRIVYASISGYGQNGPRAQAAGHDINYLGYAGVLDQTGVRGGPPALCNLQIADLLGGAASAAIAILAALVGAQRTGRGRASTSRWPTPRSRTTSSRCTRSSNGDATLPRGEDLLTGGVPCYGVYGDAGRALARRRRARGQVLAAALRHDRAPRSRAAGLRARRRGRTRAGRARRRSSPPRRSRIGSSASRPSIAA